MPRLGRTAEAGSDNGQFSRRRQEFGAFRRGYVLSSRLKNPDDWPVKQVSGDPIERSSIP